MIQAEVIRATEGEAIPNQNIENLHQKPKQRVENQISIISKAAIQNQNIFEKLMDAAEGVFVRTNPSALFEVGGQYRRNII